MDLNQSESDRINRGQLVKPVTRVRAWRRRLNEIAAFAFYQSKREQVGAGRLEDHIRFFTGRGTLMDTLFGEGQSGFTVVLFVIVVLGLLALAFWLLRQFGGGRVNATTRGGQPRLAVIDQATVDSRRRLVLIRRDNVEHLLIIGGPSDVVVEPNIVRAATAVPETGARRPPAMPRAPLGEDSMSPLQPGPAPPGAPAPRKARTADRRAELTDELSRLLVVGERAEQRRPPRLQPAPPARSTAEATLKSATAETAQPPAPRKARTADPLARLADELSRVPGVNAPARSTAVAALEPATDQNLSEIAQRLEATLRRPAKSKEDARTAAGDPKRAGEQAAPELAAPSREPERQGCGDDKAASEPAAPPREPDTQGRGDDGSNQR